jgi:hypothetical protein
MSRTRSYQKKKEGKLRKLENEELKKEQVKQKNEAEEAKQWEIGAKDNTKKIAIEAKRQNKIDMKMQKKIIYEDETK